MKHKVSELEGALLDMAVAMAEGWAVEDPEDDPTAWTSPDGKEISSITDTGIAKGYGYHPSHFWSQGGPIIQRERIEISPLQRHKEWSAAVRPRAVAWGDYDTDGEGEGPTPLIAAMRAYCASKFGEEVELP